MGQHEIPDYDLNEHAVASFLEIAMDYAPGAGDHLAVDSNSPPVADAGYKILDRIGEGGMGTVWRAQQLGTGQIVALKALKRDLVQRPGALARFHTEVQLAASLKHPLIARVFDSGLDRLDYFYVMELIEGHPIDEALAAGEFTTREVVELVVDVCEAVGYAHACGVVHLDLKPTNILVSDDGRPHILDFGLARAVGIKRSNDDLPTYRAGTHGYMAPEQIQVDNTIDQRADVYALGRILNELLAIVSHVGNIASISDLETIILKATSQSPGSRYQDAAALALDLNNWLELKPVTSRHASVLYTSSMWVRRKRRTLRRVFLVVIPLVIVIAAIGAALHHQDVSTRAIGILNDATLYQSTLQSVRTKLIRGEVQQAQRLLADTKPDARGWEWSYLSGLADQSTHTIAFEGGVIRDFVIMRDGTVTCLMSSGGLNQVTLKDGGWNVTGLDPGVDHPMVLGGSAEFIIHLDGEGRGILQGVSKARSYPRVQLTEAALSHTIVSPDGRYVFTCSYHAGLMLYDNKANKVAYRVQQPNGAYVTCFSQDNRHLAWYDGEYRVLNLANMAVSNHSLEHPGEESPKALAVFGSTLYAGYSDGVILSHELDSLSEAKQLARLPSNISTMSVSPDGGVIVCGGVDGAIYLITNSDQSYRRLQGHVGAVTKVRFSDDGKRLYSLSTTGRVKAWDTEWIAYESKPWPTEHATLSAMDASGRIMACALQDSVATLFESNSLLTEVGPKQQNVVAFDMAPTALVLTHNANWMGVADQGRTVRVYADAMVLANFEMTHEPAYWLSFDLDERRLAASNSMEVVVMGVGDDTPMRWFGRIGPCAWLKTAPALLTMVRYGQTGYALEVRDVDADTQVFLDSIGRDPVIAMAVAKDVGRVAIADSGGMIKVYDIDTGNEYKMESAGGNGSVLSLALSPDGARLVTAGDSVMVWSVVHGQVLDVLHMPAVNPIMSIQFTDDGKELVGRGLTGYCRWRAR